MSPAKNTTVERIILGIDPGTNLMGYGVIRTVGSKAEFVQMGVLDIRKVGDTYCFIYSSILHHELCYATSASPVEGFRFRGTLVSNVDAGIDRYKPAERRMAYPGNNHGSIARIGGQWHVFYHRHSNGHGYSRQACMEPIELRHGCEFVQAEITSRGPNGGPLPGEGSFPAYAAACAVKSTRERSFCAGPVCLNRFSVLRRPSAAGWHPPG